MHGERSSRHRGARANLSAAVFAFGAVLLGAASNASAGGAGAAPVDSALVIWTAGYGSQNVDLPRFGQPSETMGWSPMVSFALGAVVRRWCEPFAELSYSYLPGPDSVRVVSDQDTVLADIGTLTQLQGGVLIRPRSGGVWQPYARFGAGVARLSVASPGEFATRATDAIWTAGAGLEWWALRHWIVRAEARYTGQASADGTRSHTALQVALGYAFGRDLLRP